MEGNKRTHFRAHGTVLALPFRMHSSILYDTHNLTNLTKLLERIWSPCCRYKMNVILKQEFCYRLTGTLCTRACSRAALVTYFESSHQCKKCVFFPFAVTINVFRFKFLFLRLFSYRVKYLRVFVYGECIDHIMEYLYGFVVTLAVKYTRWCCVISFSKFMRVFVV